MKKILQNFFKKASYFSDDDELNKVVYYIILYDIIYIHELIMVKDYTRKKRIVYKN